MASLTGAGHAAEAFAAGPLAFVSPAHFAMTCGNALRLVPAGGPADDGAAGERLRDQYADQIKGWQTTYQGGAWPGCGGRVDVNLLTADGIAPFRAPRDHVVTDRYWVAESPLDASSVDIYAIDPDQRAENPAAVATVNIRRALRFATEAEAQAWCINNPAPRFSPSLYEDREVTQ